MTSDLQTRLNIPHLYRYWQRRIAEPVSGSEPDCCERDLDATLLSGLSINILEAARFLNAHTKPSFEDLEQWVIDTNGGSMDQAELNRLRDALAGLPVASAAGNLDNVQGLAAEELAFWEEHGYVVVKNAVPPESRDAAAAAIYEFLDASPDDPDSWYGKKFGHSIWVPLLRHPACIANRKAPRLVKAFAQLWGREDLWPTIDQGGLNPPVRPTWPFPGPHVHWDGTLAPPHRFGTQGILYLTDTPADQGAFCCIPGLHRTLDDWLATLRPGENPRDAIRKHSGLVPIAGRAGDLVIWHHLLPHGASPNRGKLPRVAQYISMWPTRWKYTAEWL